MPDPTTYRPAPGTIPTEPGVYKFRDPHGRVIYVGKAKNLRSRLSNYFADLTTLHPRTRKMVTTAAAVEWTVVDTEVEALQLEYNWIKRYDPRFNVRYRDDKTYPMLAVSTGEQIPRVFVYRGPRRKGVRYFGPYSHAWAIRETVDQMLRVFPARTCSAGVLRRHQQLGRPCLLGYIGKCAAPCVGRVSVEEHRQIVDDFCNFLAGRTDRYVRQVEKEMLAASEELDFERAARLRDDLGALRKALEKQSVVLGDGTDADVIALAADELEVAVQVFHVRGGRVRGQRGWVVEHEQDASTSRLVAQFLTQFYGGEIDQAERSGIDTAEARGVIPREVLVPALPEEAGDLVDWLSVQRGSQVRIRVPQRGDKKDLAETVRRNAEHALGLHKLKRAGDLTTRSAALQGIQDALELDEAPLRIECVDISHIQGTDVVASLVVFEDGLAKKSDYRRYAIREAAGDGRSDDVASIAEVTRRRFKRHRADPATGLPVDERHSDTGSEPGAGIDGNGGGGCGNGGNGGNGGDYAPEAAIDPATGRPRRFAYPPNLYLVDGGAPQVAAAAEVLDELGVTDVALAGLAKRLEEVWVPGEEDPVILPRGSEALYLLQRVRDEAHRFAITYHRSRRSKRMTASALDGIPGLGEVRRNALVSHFGSLAQLKQATVDEMTEVPGIGRATAQAIVGHFHRNGDGAGQAAQGGRTDDDGSLR